MLAILEPAELEKMAARAPGDREAIARQAHEDAEKAAAAVHDEIAGIQALSVDVELCDLLVRNENWWNKNIAHALETTRMEQKATKAGIELPDPKWVDVFALKARTNEIVSRLMNLVTDTETFYERVESVYAHYADAFWESFVEKPR